MLSSKNVSAQPAHPRAIMFAAMAAASLATLTAATDCRAQCADWRARGAGLHLNGIVYDSTLWDPDGAGPQAPMLVVAGHFSKAGGADGIGARNIAAWDGVHWHALGAGVGDESGIVYALTVYNGDLIAGGFFTTAGGAPANRIARWNGATWSALGEGVAGGDFPSISALTVYNGELIAGGLFTSAGGQAANHIASWNGTAWNTLGAGIQIVSSFGVQALAVYNGALIAGGTFAFAGEEPVFNIARWNGVWSPMDDIFGDTGMTEVAALTVYNNDLIAGGRFSQAGDVNARNIARFDGTRWRALGAGVAGNSFAGVSDLGVYNGELVATGAFTTADGNPTNNIARWNGSAWVPVGSGIAAVGQALSVFGSDLVVGGSFLEAGGAVVKSLARWTGAQWSDIPGVLRPSGDFGVRTIASWAGSVVLGGYYSTTDTNEPVFARSLTAWDGQTLRPLGEPDSIVLASSVAPGAANTTDLIVGGQFEVIDGIPANAIARLSDAPGAVWQPMGDGFDNDVAAITQFNGSTYAAGWFTASGGAPMNRIARWNGAAWQTVAPGVVNGLNGPGYALKSYPSGPSRVSLVIGGSFNSAGGVTASNVVSFNVNTETQATSWSRLGSGFNAPVYAIEYYNGSIYAAGDFDASGTTPVNHIARWSGVAWEQVGSGLDGLVRSMTVSNGTLIVGGYFTTAGGVAVDRLARWDGQQWTRVGGGANHVVHALSTFGNEIQAGGEFTRVRLGVLESPLWARFSEDGVPWFAEQPPSQEVDCGADASFHVASALGYGGLSYQWRKNGVPLSAGPTGTGSTIVTNGVSLHVLDVNQADAGVYECILSNGCGGTTSHPATLTVIGDCDPCLADFNHDGDVNSQDFFDFVTAFFAEVPAADFNHDSIINSQDLFDFLTAFFIGCE